MVKSEAKASTYIYALLDPTDDNIFYVGKSNNPRLRFEQYLCDKKSNIKRIQIIQRLISKGIKPKLIILSKVPMDSWKYYERSYIKDIREAGHNLTNIRKGGDGSSVGTSHINNAYFYDKDEPYSVDSLNEVKRFYN